MKLIVPAATLLVAFSVMAAGCGSDGRELTLEEYFQLLEATQRDSEQRLGSLEESLFRTPADSEGAEEERVAIAQGELAELATIAREPVDALEDLDPPTEVEDAHNEFVDAVDAFAKMVEDIADAAAEVESGSELEELTAAFGQSEFIAAGDRSEATCSSLQEIADGSGIDVDLGCPVGEPAVLTDLTDDVKAGTVESIEVDGREVAWTVVDGRKFRTRMEVGDTIHQVLKDAGIEPEDVPPIDGD